MKLRNIVNVCWNNDKLSITISDKTGEYTITRKPRNHTKEIRNLQRENIYCFEIQGIMYWYKQHKDGIFRQWKEPENFRADERTTNKIVKSYKTHEGSIELKTPEKVIDVVPVEVEEPKQEEVEQEKEIRHEKYNQIKTCIELNIPVYLVGEAGTGKNYTLEQIAWDCGYDFYYTNSVQQEYKLTGFIDAGGKYHETEFYKAFKNGGIFFLDEIDASIPEVLVLLNAAIANRYFEFPNGRIYAHEKFRVVAAGNTVGSGADELYTGRMVLDAATLDRFVIIDFDYDRNVELSISNNNKELVDFVEDIRRQSRENGMRCTFSYRCIIQVTKLEQAGMDIKTILQIAVFKGMSKNTINQFSYNVGQMGNRYFQTMGELQRAA